MPRTSRSTRALQDRRLDLTEAGYRVGYGSETLRKMMVRGPDPKPPLVKVRGRWYANMSELDEWAIAQGLALHELDS